MAKGYVFDRRSAQRTSRAVQRVESMPTRSPQKREGWRARGSVRVFRIENIHDDYLDCKLYNPITDDALDQIVPVAKPRILQRSAFDGQTISYEGGDSFSYSYSNATERTATNTSNSETETQVVVPEYFVGDLILVTSAPTGLTSSEGIDIQQNDINTAARGWVKKAE